MKITRRQLRRIIKEEITRIAEGDVIDLPSPELPWEFGPKGYLARSELTQKMSGLEYGSDSPPEWILAIALSNRAEEMTGYQKTIDPEPFKDLAMRLYKDYIVGMAGNVEQNLHDITGRIDAGDYFDEDILDVIGYDHNFIEDIANRYLPDPMHDDPRDPSSIEEYLRKKASAYHSDPALRNNPGDIKMLLQDDFMNDVGHMADYADYEKLIDELSSGTTVQGK
jgi:hypothetical protein